MRTVADFLDLVARADVEFDTPSVHFGDHGFCDDLVPDGSRGEMAYIDGCSNCAFAGVEITSNGIQRRVLHRGDHHRRGENRRQRGILELVGKMSGRNAQCVGSFGSNGNRTHGTSSWH